MSLCDIDKARWLLQKDENILFALGTYIHSCFEKRNKNVKTKINNNKAASINNHLVIIYHIFMLIIHPKIAGVCMFNLFFVFYHGP